ncbi:cell division protein FtsQ [Algoriphagus ornithinivorans]|uniref:Cell division protein FtsQ n=1 Tax=Algoriphagus ornithinivorans TaxID=226506 RepID=A0A1I5DKP1_9BACT|nr:cell division protein [Algoriphagus ornithinivorans]SFN99845.1 cell division protein FtsQ [Algoriphagus ornithinivorans]
MKNTGLRKSLVFILLSLVLVGFIGFVEKQSLYKTFQGSEVKIGGVSGLYFVEESEIRQIISESFPELKVGMMIEEVPLKEIEKRIEGHPFVKSVQATIGQKGILNLEIHQHQPIARIARPTAADGYITVEGLIIPTSPTYTSRVLILEGKHAEKLMNKGDVNSEMPELMDLIRYIAADKFWSAQITELEVNSPTDIRMYQQVGSQIIEFGDAFNLQDKFDRIKIFYKEILPRKGWDTYSRVSVKFKDQIVCE